MPEGRIFPALDALRNLALRNLAEHRIRERFECFAGDSVDEAQDERVRGIAGRRSIAAFEAQAGCIRRRVTDPEATAEPRKSTTAGDLPRHVNTTAIVRSTIDDHITHHPKIR